MSTLGSFFAAAAGPLAKRVLQAVGVGVISYAGLAVAVNAVIGELKGAYGQLVGPVADLLNLAGLGAGIGIVLGAMLAKLSFTVTERLGRIAT